MPVTYRAIERYSARRVSSASLTSTVGLATNSNNVNTSKKVHQILCQAASFYCSRLQSILRLEVSLVGTLRLWLSNLILVVYVTLFVVPFFLVTAAAKWSIRWALTYYYCRNGIVCVTFDNQPIGWKTRASSPCWSLSVYLVDSGRVSPAEFGRSIVESVKKQSALRLVRKPEAFGWVHLWQYPKFERSLRNLVQELPPVWKHQLVTEDSVHVNAFVMSIKNLYSTMTQEYVSEVFQRFDGLETNHKLPPWRIYLIPLLVVESEKTSSSNSDCCLVIRCHRLLCHPLNSLIHKVISQLWREPDRSISYFSRMVKSLDATHRAKAIGSHPVHVSWTRPIPSVDFIDRMCHLTDATCLQIVLAAFCQSINQCYRQSARSNLTMLLEITSKSSPHDDCYKLPLGSCVLEDGRLVLDMLKKEKRNSVSYRMFQAEPSSVLSVTIDSVADSEIGSVLHWNSLPIPLNPIRLCLWTGKTTVRLGLLQHHQLVFPVKAGDVERRIHQLAAGLGVQNRRPLSPHSSLSGSPYRLTPPPTPRLME